jgi:transposase-like protein
METNREQGPIGGNKSLIVAKIPEACRDERAAVEFLEEQRWNGEPYCPRCGVFGAIKMLDRNGRRSERFLWRCVAGCRKQFTVRIGTVMEDSRIPFRFWCLAFYRACASKKGVSALQIKRETGLSYKSELFLMHRVRWAMTDSAIPRGNLTGRVETDETYVGGRRRGGGPGRGDNKTPVVAMVERGGRVRAYPVARVTAANLKAAILEHISLEATLLTDENPSYPKVGRNFKGGHHTVNHSHKEYARGWVNTNSVESFFALLKRGVMGTFHSVSPKHLHRYVTEFEFRYNYRFADDGERTVRAIRSSFGKRLLYKTQIAGD